MNGEGFAFHAWHTLRWPGLIPGVCRLHEDYQCYRLWKAGLK